MGLTSIVCLSSLSGKQTEVRGSTMSWEISKASAAFGQLCKYNEFDCHWMGVGVGVEGVNGLRPLSTLLFQQAAGGYCTHC